MLELVVVTCSSCESNRDSKLAYEKERPVCPNCGTSTVKISMHVTSIVQVAGSASLRLKPEIQYPGWCQRWAKIQADIQRLTLPRTEPLSSNAIHLAYNELHSFFVQLYHLKDWLIKDSQNTSIPCETIESTITKTPELALLADLANLDKHGELSRPPRSGDIPKIIEVTGVMSKNSGWHLAVEIEHKGKAYDGLKIAMSTVRAWERNLKSWLLI